MTALGIPLLSNKHVSRLLAALTAVTATALLGVTLVYALEWPVQQELPESTSVESWDTIDVGLGSGDLYVSWAFSATDTTGPPRRAACLVTLADLLRNGSERHVGSGI